MEFCDTLVKKPDKFSGKFSYKPNGIKMMFIICKRILRFSLFGCLVLFLPVFGCVAPYTEIQPVEPPKLSPKSPYDSAVCERNKAHRVESDGSLWQENGYLSGLFVNPKARRVGDIITIKIIETSSASNQASTKTSRKSGLSASIESFFNAEKRFPSVQPFFNPFSKVKGSMESDFDGFGSTKRSGALEAYITANVIEVMTNGNLKIKGSREVTVNNDNQLIALTGTIRPRDISPDNVILSTYISDAKISYSGSGVINDRQRPGWMVRIFDVVWPF